MQSRPPEARGKDGEGVVGVKVMFFRMEKRDLEEVKLHKSEAAEGNTE